MFVVIRHGASTAAVTHTTPTYNGVNLTQVGDPIYDANSANTTRRFSLWKMVDPPTGSNTLAGGFSASVTQYSVTAVVAQDAEDINGASLAAIENQSSSTNMDLTITAGAATSLVYVTVMSAGSADPFTPQGVTEVEDSDTDATTTNHHFATGYASATGSSQTLGFDSGTAAGWGGLALEVTALSAASFPSAPTNPTATPVSASQIDLSWDALTGATGYDIERDGEVIVSNHATTSYSDTGLLPGTEYDYRVRGIKDS